MNGRRKKRRARNGRKDERWIGLLEGLNGRLVEEWKGGLVKGVEGWIAREVEGWKGGRVDWSKVCKTKGLKYGGERKG